MASADIDLKLGSYSHPVEVSGDIFKAFLCSHVCHLFMGDAKNSASEIGSFMGCFIGNIWTVSTVILPSFKKTSVN